jgi:hypothetical protein
MFLHMGLWHVGFNVLALVQIGPEIEEIFGWERMLCFYLVSGLVANLGSLALGLSGVQAGASGAIMGLCGVAAGWGQRDGTTVGRHVRNEMLRWGAYTMVFGLFVHADHAAHAVGFASGAILGFASRPAWLRRQAPSVPTLLSGLTAAALAVTLVVLVFLAPRGHATVEPAYRGGLPTPTFSAPQVTLIAQACDEYQRGATDQAIERLDTLGHEEPTTADEVASLCEQFRSVSELCAHYREMGLPTSLDTAGLPGIPPEMAQYAAFALANCQLITAASQGRSTASGTDAGAPPR